MILLDDDDMERVKQIQSDLVNGGLIEKACDVAKTVVVRDYNDHGSVDYERASTDEEFVIIRSVIYGALYTFTHTISPNDITTDKIQVILDTAEVTAMKLFETVPKDTDTSHINCYDTIYNSLKKIIGVY